MKTALPLPPRISVGPLGMTMCDVDVTVDTPAIIGPLDPAAVSYTHLTLPTTPYV